MGNPLKPVIPPIQSAADVAKHLDTIKGIVLEGGRLIAKGGDHELYGAGALLLAINHMRALAKATAAYEKPIRNEAWKRGPSKEKVHDVEAEVKP